jgi:uncharacterized protein YkwD
MRPLIQADLERRVALIVNDERRKAGLGRLSMDVLLGRAARAHAGDMAARDYFSHFSPEGSTVADRVAASGYAFSVVGENLALGQRNPRQVMTAWMHSRGHRANIVSEDYSQIGVGVVVHPDGSLIWVQNFATPLFDDDASR